MKTRIIAFKDWQTHLGITYAYSEKTYLVTIQQDIRLKRLIKACHFHEVMRGGNDSLLPEDDLPLQAEYSLLRFEHEISGLKARKLFAAIKVQPATLRESLCFFLSLPKLRPLQYDTIALGERWYDKRDKKMCIPFIDTYWRLRLTIDVGCYTSQDVFLVRNVPQKA